jgi:precorrin-6B methylase 1
MRQNRVPPLFTHISVSDSPFLRPKSRGSPSALFLSPVSEFNPESAPKPVPELAPGLYLVGTPIGNLEDITLRALRVLRQADRIACEDTRQTQKLLNHFEIKTPTVSLHQHNERERAVELISALRAGQRIAVVSDAGMPGISDPGGWLTQAAIAAGIAVYAIPGANAAVSALVASGLSTADFQFLGFLPEKAGARRTRLESLANTPTFGRISQNPDLLRSSRTASSKLWPTSNPSGDRACGS